MHDWRHPGLISKRPFAPTGPERHHERHRARVLRAKFDLATRRSFPRRRPYPRPRRQLTGKKLGDLKKPLPKKTLARRTGNLRSQAIFTLLRSPGSSKIWRGSGTFPVETLPTAMPNHRPSFPRTPLSPHPIRSKGAFKALPPKANF